MVNIRVERLLIAHLIIEKMLYLTFVIIEKVYWKLAFILEKVYFCNGNSWYANVYDKNDAPRILSMLSLGDQPCSRHVGANVFFTSR